MFIPGSWDVRMFIPGLWDVRMFIPVSWDVRMFIPGLWDVSLFEIQDPRKILTDLCWLGRWRANNSGLYMEILSIRKKINLM